MKVIILAAGQGTRLRPLTNEMPKCMVKINGKSIIEWQLDNFARAGFAAEDIMVVTGYQAKVLERFLRERHVNSIFNAGYMTTNMVCSLMCAKDILQKSEDIIVSYGDIVYTQEVLQKIMVSQEDISVCVDKGWYGYWQKRCTNPLDDAETLKMDSDNFLLEIGQKTDQLSDVEAQYIGLMRFKGNGLRSMLALCEEAKNRSQRGQSLWRTDRSYEKMYMTDLLQGLIDIGAKLKAVEINRGWFEVDCISDLKLAEREW